MGHLNEGQVQAYVDGALREDVRAQVQGHLEMCPRCAQLAAGIEARAASVRMLLSATDGSPASCRPSQTSSAAPALSTAMTKIEHKPVSPQVARQKFRDYLEEKKEHKMRQNPFSRRYRPAWAIVVLVAFITLTLTFPPMRALANSFLALFRVQKITFVEFNPLNLPDNQTMQSAAMEVERLVSEEVVFEPEGESQTVDAATARSLVAFPVRFPSAMADVHQIDVQPAMRMTMKIDLPRVQMLLDSLGYHNVALPESLDGADVSIELASSVTASYGACTSTAKDDCTLVIQMPSPNVEAPPEIDVQQLGQLYLQMLGMSSSEAARFSRRIDWTTTLVVPIPSTEAKYQDVLVDGVTGTFIQARDPDAGPEYVLMWVKNDIVYAIVGSGDQASALEIAGSLE